MDLDPATLSPADRYKLLIGTIVPRPIAFVSTISVEGRPNVAPFSFFNGVCGTPMTLLFCPSNKPDGSMKDTLRNLLEGSERGDGVDAPFVVNVAAEESIRQVVACAEDLEFGESEFELAGLTVERSERIRAPRVAESPMCFECEVIQVVRLAPGEPGGGNIVIGRVVWARAAPGLVDDRFHVDPAQLAAVGRMAGLSYCTTRQRFDVPWGRAALQAPDPLARLGD